ncbi:hypothetical protein [Williamsia deligens]|uniref:Secreted protein n=1 Tax=Williamsia deligens TaxID=321325 RepID=A0ABW3G0R8_9NOCA|nr:hypothetical protein [Williamsia deligens]MCP2194959.1 hypothetical protein [Williamsia deligens]
MSSSALTLSLRRAVAAGAVAASLLAGGVAVAGPASADPVASPEGAAAAALASPTLTATSGADVVTLLDQANKTLRALGIQPFLNPSVAFNCTTPTPSNPFGLLPAAGGAIAGPWAAPGLSLPNIPLVNIDPNVVKDGQTLYGFVPAGVTSDPTATGMQVAWFNTATGKFGIAQMGKAGQTLVDAWLKNVPASPLKTMAANTLSGIVNTIAPAGSRLAPVDTGKGTVLSAVFGTVNNGGRSCFFLPMVGVTNA